VTIARARIEGHPSFIDLVLHNETIISGRWLTELLDALRAEFGDDVSAGTNLIGEEPPLRFVIRVHGASVADRVRITDWLMSEAPPAQPALHEGPPGRLDVRYVHEGIAYIDPEQALPLGTYLEHVSGLTGQVDGTVRLGHAGGQLVVCVDRGSAAMTFTDHEATRVLSEHLRPIFAHSSRLTGGLIDGQVWFRLRVPPGFTFEHSLLLDLDGVVADPAPKLWGTGTARPQLEFCVGPHEVALDTIADTWWLGAQVVYQIGIHPRGMFQLQYSSDVQVTYTPPAQSGLAR
jgi:hypothetical protein